MTERQLRMAITEPAKKAGSKVDDDLVSVLLAEMHNGQPGATGAGALPLLSHALDQAWRTRTGNTVTLADYERTGGIEGAVATSAQHTYDALTPGQQAIAQQVFTRLAATTGEGLDTADRATRAELITGKDTAEVRDLEEVLEAFAAERLLTLAAGTVEISHEVLLTAWPLLRDTWLADTFAERVIRTRLRSTAAEWERDSRDPSYLYSGSLLQAAAGTVAQTHTAPARPSPLSPSERDFLRASEFAQQRTARKRQAVIAGLVSLTLVASIAAGVAVYNAATAARQHTLAVSRQLAAESLIANLTSPVIARQLAIAAWQAFPTSQADTVMGDLLAEQQEYGLLPADPVAVRGIAISPSGRLLASADADGTVRLWNPLTGQPVGAPLRADIGVAGGVRAVAFSPKRQLLASAGTDGVVRVWHPLRRQLVCSITADTGHGVYGVAFSPDGTLLASADGDGTVRLWNPVTCRALPPLKTHHPSPPNGGARGVAFSPDGTRLAGAFANGTVRLWNPVTGRAVATLQTTSTAAEGGVLGVAFSPERTLLASADGNGMVQLWNWATGQAFGKPLPAGSPVLGVAFGPGGTRLASADEDGTVRLWNPRTGRTVARFAPPAIDTPRSALGVAFSPGGMVLASADGDGTVRLWNTTTGQPVGAAMLANTQNNASTQNRVGTQNSVVALSPDGTRLASGGGAGALHLLRMVTGLPAGAPITTGTQDGVRAMAFSPDNTLLASADDDGTVRLWQPLDGRPTAFPFTPSGTGAVVVALGFSPDGKQLTTVGANGVVQLWEARGSVSVSVPYSGTSSPRTGVAAVAFSPDRRLLAIAGTDGVVRLWNPLTRHLIGVPFPIGSGASRGVAALAFSPDEKLLAIAGTDGVVRLRNPVTGEPGGVPIRAGTGPRNRVDAMAFNPDGQVLATASADGAVRLWNTFNGQFAGAPIPAGTGLGDGVDGVTFSAGGQLLATADAGGTVRLWDVWPFAHPYAALCADVGPPTRQSWDQNAPGQPQPKICV
jgi:WD40 repeat protein